MTELERRRKIKGYTQKEMAKKSNVSIGCYNMYENNQRKVPVQKAEIFAQILECSVADIFTPAYFTNCEIVET